MTIKMQLFFLYNLFKFILFIPVLQVQIVDVVLHLPLSLQSESLEHGDDSTKFKPIRQNNKIMIEL